MEFGNRKRSILARFAMALSTLAAIAQPAIAEDFCAQLKSIVGEMPNGFSAFRGAQISANERYHYATYSATGWPVGATNCYIVMQQVPGEKAEPTYTCEFPYKGSDKWSETSALSQIAERCLALKKPDTDEEDNIVTLRFSHGRGELGFWGRDPGILMQLSSHAM